MENPFYYGGVVYDEHFCDRESEIETIENDIRAGMNLLLYAPRRFGKTSLVMKALRDLRTRDGFHPVFLDLMPLTDTREFVDAYFDAIARSLEGPAEKIVNFFKQVVKIRPNVTVSFDASGNPRYALSFSSRDIQATLEEVLEAPLLYARSGKKIVVVFDEFQEIVPLGLEAKLRSVVQRHGSEVSYLFMGSKQSVMREIFTDKNRAFYKSVKHLPLRPIALEHWERYVVDGFERTGKSVDAAVVPAMVEVSGGFPYYTQQLAYETWEMSRNHADMEPFRAALALGLEREEDLFRQEWESLTLTQRKALKLIIAAEGKEIYAAIRLETYTITSSTLQKAVKALLKKDIIDETAGTYRPQDPLFGYWIRQNTTP
jgi:AAA+ ATPase superfamily predicted ATPase